MTARITLDRCKHRLAALWFGASGLAFMIVVLQSVQRFHGLLDDLWSWFVPTILPTLSLIIGILVADSMRPHGREKSADPFTFRTAWGVSAFYLLALLLTLLSQPFAAGDPKGQLQFLKTASLWLLPTQGLATAALGAFFIKTDAAEKNGDTQ